MDGFVEHLLHSSPSICHQPVKVQMYTTELVNCQQKCDGSTTTLKMEREPREGRERDTGTHT